ncbi:unnamed protein product [Ectocarpus sp. 8 AP-2014]
MSRPGPNLEAGTPVFLTRNNNEGILIRGGAPEGHGRYYVEYYKTVWGIKKLTGELIPITELALPLMNWPTKKFFSRASTSGGQVNLYLPEKTKVVLVTSTDTRGELVEGGPPTSDDRYLVTYANQQGAAREEKHQIGNLAVPLDSWWTPPSWPHLPVGTTMVWSENTTACTQLLTTMDKPPSTHNLCRVRRADGKQREVALYRLVEPLTSWWRKPSDFEEGRQTHGPLPVDTRVAVESPNDWHCKLVYGPSTDGVYEVYVSADDRTYVVHGTHLAVPLQTRLNLHQIEALKQHIDSLKTQVERQDADVRKLESTEITTAATLKEQKSERERDTESIRTKFEGAKQTIVLLRKQLEEKESQISELKTLEEERDSNITELKRKETNTAIALAKKNTELEKAEERISKIAHGGRLMLSSAGEHDYGSDLPSPADLVKRIKSIQDQQIADWVAEALEDPSQTWLVSQDASEAIERPKKFVLQVLVETVRECYRRVHDCVSRRTDQMTKAMGEFVGVAHDGRLAEEVAHFKRNAFHKGYKEMFADVCPVSPTDQTKLAQDIFRGLAECRAISNESPMGPTALFVKTQAFYEDIVKTLLLTFLECEVQQSGPLKFSEEFAKIEAWNPEDHFRESVDPSYVGDKPVEGSTQVQVVIPRLFSEKKVGDTVSKTFQTKALFVFLPSK